MFRNLIVVFVAGIILTLVGCGHTEMDEGQQGDAGRFMDIANENPDGGLTQEDGPQPDSPLNVLIKNDGQLTDTGKNPETSESNSKVEQPQPAPDDQQQALTGDLSIDTAPETKYQAQQLEENQTDTASHLPFKNFKARWNAVSEANFTELYIHDFGEQQNDVGITYTSALNDQMELRVRVTGDYVQSIAISSKQNVNHTKMLAAWSQVISILHTDVQIYDVDGFFHEIGVGPNGDLSNLKEGIFSSDKIVYEIHKLEDSYTFQGAYR